MEIGLKLELKLCTVLNIQPSTRFKTVIILCCVLMDFIKIKCVIDETVVVSVN